MGLVPETCSEGKTVSGAYPVLDLIGNTPLIPLRFGASEGGVTIWAKCEFLNPSGSIKDRLAKCVVLDAEQRGLLRKDSIILECTSGNTGIAFAMVGAVKGYKVAILMSEGASGERRQLIEQLGAELILFGSSGNYQTGIDISLEMAAKDSRYFLPRQFENPLNVRDHEEYTGQEIITQMEQQAGPGGVGGEGIGAFVAGYGTGGTLAGCGLAIKKRYPNAQVIAMEPGDKDVLAGECPCCRVMIEGVANGYLPALLKKAPLDGVKKILGVEAMAMTRRLQREFGLLVGTSSGANVAAALAVAKDLGPGAKVVTILCDRAERYFSTELFKKK